MTESIRKINYDINHLRRENRKNLIRITILDLMEHLNLKESLIFLNAISDKFLEDSNIEDKPLAKEVIEEMKTDFRETINERAV